MQETIMDVNLKGVTSADLIFIIKIEEQYFAAMKMVIY